jgi:hypothetical protein
MTENCYLCIIRCHKPRISLLDEQINEKKLLMIVGIIFSASSLKTLSLAAYLFVRGSFVTERSLFGHFTRDRPTLKLNAEESELHLVDC